MATDNLPEVMRRKLDVSQRGWWLQFWVKEGLEIGASTRARRNSNAYPFLKREKYIPAINAIRTISANAIAS
jgi:hypothetical protein